jgi:hypothetical protein
MTQASGANEPFAERLAFGEGTVVLRATAATTGGAMTIFEEVPPLLDTPPHVHTREDELFYILEGEHIVERGEMSSASAPVTPSSCREACRMRSDAYCLEKAGCWSCVAPPGSRSSFATLPPPMQRAGSAPTLMRPLPRGPESAGYSGREGTVASDDLGSCGPAPASRLRWSGIAIVRAELDAALGDRPLAVVCRRPPLAGADGQRQTAAFQSDGHAYGAPAVAGRSRAWRLKSRMVRAISSGSSLIGT